MDDEHIQSLIDIKTNMKKILEDAKMQHTKISNIIKNNCRHTNLTHHYDFSGHKSDQYFICKLCKTSLNYHITMRSIPNKHKVHEMYRFGKFWRMWDNNG